MESQKDKDEEEKEEDQEESVEESVEESKEEPFIETYQGGHSFKFNKSRLIMLGIFLLIIWFSLLGFFWMKADVIDKDPCSICAQRLGEDISCTTMGANPIVREYNSNGSIVDIVKNNPVNNLLTE